MCAEMVEFFFVTTSLFMTLVLAYFVFTFWQNVIRLGLGHLTWLIYDQSENVCWSKTDLLQWQLSSEYYTSSSTVPTITQKQQYLNLHSKCSMKHNTMLLQLHTYNTDASLGIGRLTGQMTLFSLNSEKSKLSGFLKAACPWHLIL